MLSLLISPILVSMIFIVLSGLTDVGRVLLAHQCFVVFDVLLVNGKNLASVPFGQRIENLPKYVECF